jgi:3-phenylpropionate/trans-cinnamate dioxygenase ferredoxin reductase subunit
MTLKASATVLVVGAGHATGEFATALRQEGFKGRIVACGDESHLPYQRPPLSKAYLAGDVTVDSLHLRPRAAYEKAQIEFNLGVRVEEIDRKHRRALLSDGRAIEYTHLVLNTGGRARRLAVPGADLAHRMNNFRYVRTIDDVDELRRHMQHGQRLVIVGGGYIGLEVAAHAIKRGMQVTVLEALPRVLARVTAPEISTFYERIHRAAGVDIRTGVEVRGFAFDPSQQGVSGILCADGTCVPADIVVAGIGLIPNTELAQAAGLAVDNGIVVDEYTRTSDPDIYSAGDCTNHPSALYDRRVRLESVPNAVGQARTAAAALCGKLNPYNAVPWFWSDQYHLKLQMAGLSQGYDQLVVRGSLDHESFAAFYLRHGKIISADSVNRPQEFMFAKRAIAAGATIDPQRLADESIPVKALLAQ